MELVDKHLARVYEKSWPSKKKEKKNIRKEERKKKRRKRKKMGLAKLLGAKIVLKLRKIFYRFQRKRVLCGKCSWVPLVRDVSWV